jgi:hypothetical protein
MSSSAGSTSLEMSGPSYGYRILNKYFPCNVWFKSQFREIDLGNDGGSMLLNLDPLAWSEAKGQ